MRLGLARELRDALVRWNVLQEGAMAALQARQADRDAEDGGGNDTASRGSAARSDSTSSLSAGRIGDDVTQPQRAADDADDGARGAVDAHEAACARP